MIDRDPSSSRWRAVAKSIEWALRDALSADSSTAIEILSACRDQLLSDTEDPDAAVEIARRIAEAKLSLLHDRSDAADTFESCWVEMQTLGYSNLEREASMLWYVLDFTSRQVERRTIAQEDVRSRLRTVIDEMRTSGHHEMAEHFADAAERLGAKPANGSNRV